MGGDGGTTVRGADEVQRTLQDLADTLEDLDAPGRAAGGLIVKAAQGYARRRTGAMRSSIVAQVTTAGVQVSAGGGIRRPYPAVQEYGSRRHGITPNAYMGRAADTQERAVVGEYDSAVTAAADNVRGI